MKVLATLLGVALLAIGVAGFVPDLNPDGRLFGVMPMTTVLSALFVISGIAGSAIGMSGRRHLAPPRSTGTNDMRPWV